MSEIKNFTDRVQKIEDVLSSAAAGDFSCQIDIPEAAESDLLNSVEYGINLMLSDMKEARENEGRHKRELEKSLEISLRQTEELESALETIKRQQASIRELSTPILQLWEDVLAMPIIGVVDTKRSMDIMERLLSEIKKSKYRFVILDITGVEIVDTKTADYFIRIVKAAQLLGAACVLTGIQPTVAQTLIEIGVDLSSIRTVSTLHDGLRECLKLKQESRTHYRRGDTS